MKDFLKRALLTVKGYANPRAYWNLRWRLGLDAEVWTMDQVNREYELIAGLMKKAKCESILDVGCGRAQLRHLDGYMGMDFSKKALEQSGLKSFIYGNIADVKLAVPSNSFDAVMTRYVLQHIPFGLIDKAVVNMCRISKKLIVLREAKNTMDHETHFHCFTHDLEGRFQDYCGAARKVVFLNELLPGKVVLRNDTEKRGSNNY